MKAKITFKVITPIFIGSGEEYYPTDYIPLDNKLCFIDREKLINELVKHNMLDDFINMSDSLQNFLDFVREFSKNTGWNKICKDFIDAPDYVLKNLSKSHSRPLYAFIKDKFLFKPIIPGSSIKGAIRTAVFNYILKQNPHLKNESNINRLEAKVFCNDDKLHPKKDIFKALFIEDLKPISYKLKALFPQNFPKKANRVNYIPVVIETLVDGIFEGELRIDKSLLKSINNPYFKDFNLDFIKKSLEDFYSNIIETENKLFKKVYPQNYEKYKIKIGRFSGAGSKSLDIRKIYIKQLRKELNYQTSVWSINKDPMGWAKLELEGE